MDINSLKAVEKQKVLKNGEISQLLILYIYYYDNQDLDVLIFFGVMQHLDGSYMFYI